MLLAASLLQIDGLHCHLRSVLLLRCPGFPPPSARQRSRPCSHCGFQLSPEVPINHVIKVFNSPFRTLARLRHMLLRHLIETLIQVQTFVYLITITENFHPPIFQLSYLTQRVQNITEPSTIKSIIFPRN